MTSAMRIVSQVGGASKTGQSTLSDRRRIRISVHLQSRSDKGIDRVLAGQLREDSVGTESSISTRRENIWASSDIIIHTDLASKALHALDPPAFNSGTQFCIRVHSPVLANLFLQSHRVTIC